MRKLFFGTLVLFVSAIFAQTQIEQSTYGYNIYLINGYYQNLDRLNPDKKSRNQTFLISGVAYELNLEKETIKIKTDHIALLPLLTAPLTIERAELTISLDSWHTVVVIESSPEKVWRTVYGRVPVTFNGATEYKYRIVQPRTRIN